MTIGTRQNNIDRTKQNNIDRTKQNNLDRTKQNKIDRTKQNNIDRTKQNNIDRTKCWRQDGKKNYLKYRNSYPKLKQYYQVMKTTMRRYHV